jgi:hypothetical protein
MRRAIVAVVACASVLALGAPGASADVTNDTVDVCSGTADWTVNLVGAYADINVTSSTCKWLDASVDDDANVHVNTHDGPFTGSTRVSLVGINVVGTNSFVGTAVAYIGGGPVEVVSPSTLNATIEGVWPTSPSSSTAEYLGTQSCGTNCYRTEVHWVHAFTNG